MLAEIVNKTAYSLSREMQSSKLLWGILKTGDYIMESISNNLAEKYHPNNLHNGLKGKCLLDLGAGKTGPITCYFARLVGTEGSIVAIESNQKSYTHLCQSIKDKKDCRTVDVLLGDALKIGDISCPSGKKFDETYKNYFNVSISTLPTAYLLLNNEGKGTLEGFAKQIHSVLKEETLLPTKSYEPSSCSYHVEIHINLPWLSNLLSKRIPEIYTPFFESLGQEHISILKNRYPAKIFYFKKKSKK